MIDLIDIVNESSMLCEAFKDPRIYQVWKTLQRYNIKWSDIFRYHIHIAWDKIDNSDIDEIDTIDTKVLDNLFKSARKVKAGKDERPFIVFGMKNELIDCVYDPYYGQIGLFSKYHMHDRGTVTWYDQPQNSRNRMTQTEQFGRMKECDYLLKVYVDVKNVSDLMNARSQAKGGAWMLTKNDHESKHLSKGILGVSTGGRSDIIGYDSFYKMCGNMAQRAVEKWKKIIAENKFKKDQDTSEVDNAVKDIMMRLPNACMNVTKDPDKYGDMVKYRLEDLMKSVYDKYSYSGSGRHGYQSGHDAVLVLYQKYCQTVIELKKPNSIYNTADSDLKKRDEYKKQILEACKKADILLKKFDA